MIFRCIIKPFKRWEFNRAKLYTYYYIQIYNKKYIIKYLNKRKKIAKLKSDKNLILLIDKLAHNDLLIKLENDDNLNNINKKDLGLDHSKVREYLLKRGPKIFIKSIILLTSNYVLYIYFKEIDFKTNIYLIALLLSLYMLYYRLPDSIESAIARTTHDYYVKNKNELYNN